MTTHQENTTDPFATFKAAQREGWGLFAPFEVFTLPASHHLVQFAGVKSGERVLDVACGTGVVAVTAARLGTKVTGLDLSPALLERAKFNASVAEVEVSLTEGDVEMMPFEDNSFDVVLSQFGHIFAPRPQVAITEMLRVLKPGGKIAFATWPPELYTGRMFALVARYLPPPPDIAPPVQWGEPKIVRERLGESVTDIVFERERMLSPTLSPQHFLKFMESAAAPVIKLVAALKEEPSRLAAFRKEMVTLMSECMQGNAIKQDFLMTRAKKR